MIRKGARKDADNTPLFAEGRGTAIFCPRRPVPGSVRPAFLLRTLTPIAS